MDSVGAVRPPTFPFWLSEPSGTQFAAAGISPIAGLFARRDTHSILQSSLDGSRPGSGVRKAVHKTTTGKFGHRRRMGWAGWRHWNYSVARFCEGLLGHLGHRFNLLAALSSFVKLRGGAAYLSLHADDCGLGSNIHVLLPPRIQVFRLAHDSPSLHTLRFSFHPPTNLLWFGASCSNSLLCSLRCSAALFASTA